MHSTLRKELCGTPKILQTIRARPISRPAIRRRNFSNKTCLLDQSGPKNNNASCNSSDLGRTSNSDTSTSSPDASAHNIIAELEKWIQVYSDKGQSLHIWDTISEKDENGRRRLLPHVKRDLEQLGPWTSQDGTAQQTIGLEIQDGRIRPLTSKEVKHARESTTEKVEQRDKIIVQTDQGAKDTTTQDALQSSSSDEIPSAQQSAHSEESDVVMNQNLANGGGGAPQDLESSVSRFHGSSAARRQRERQSRLKDKPHAIILPEWFSERNVLLWGKNELTITKPAQVEPLWGLDDQPIKLIPTAMQSTSIDPEGTQVMKEDNEDSKEEDAMPEKEQTFSSEPGSDKPADKNSTSPDFDSTSSNSSGLIALPHSKKRYYVHVAQRTELTLTARGRLRLPASGSSSNKPAGIRSHLLVHYTANDGDIFLDRLIEDVARQLRCDLITLDAQDISALISRSDIDPMMVDEAKALSYEIYSEIYKEEGKEDEVITMFSDEMDEADEDGPAVPQGMPFAIGKPITIDLKAIFGPRSRRNSGPMGRTNMLGEMIGRSSMNKPVPHIFQSLIDSVLSSPGNKRKISDGKVTQQAREESLKNTSLSKILPQDATIVHVKDLKAIQETNIGKHFLAQLYDQVERRRSNGEGIMLIGTSCDRSETSGYNPDRIRNLQVSEPEEISSTIVITPAYPRVGRETKSESGIRDEIQRSVVPKQDRANRVQIVNARHLYEMLQSKDVPLSPLKDGFWTRELSEQLDEADQECLSKAFWSFAHVQRLAAILASSDFSRSSHPIAQAANIIDHSDKLKFKWANAVQHEKHNRGRKQRGSYEPEDEKIAEIRSKASKHEKKLLSGVVEPRKIATTFRDIHIPAETVEALQTLTTLSLVRPDAFKYGVLASDRIPGLLLYGPPGTGKTLAAKAVARESGATMLEVSAADINDMYVGEGEKNVKALFGLAKKLSPCVVFLDEADAMFSARSNAGQRVSHRELLNQFLKEWDGMSNDSGSAFIMVATNRPMDLDDAVLRRLPRRLLIDLPTEKDRLEILKIHLRHEQLAEDVDLAKLAARTQFYSGSDLKNVAVAAALNCVLEENQIAKNHTGNEPHQHPTKRVLTFKHFEKALEEISASISEDMTSLRDIKKFDEQYGDRKGRKRRSPKWGFKTVAEADSVLDTVKVRQ